MALGAATDSPPRHHTSPLPITVTMVMAVTFVLTLTLHTCLADTGDNCQRIQVRESIIKEVTVNNLQMSCTADVDLFKCEGQCESTVTPSVRHGRGFRKNCRCCKEEQIATRTVPLTSCYHNGQLQPLSDDRFAFVSDIQSCSCLPCTN